MKVEVMALGKGVSCDRVFEVLSTEGGYERHVAGEGMPHAGAGEAPTLVVDRLDLVAGTDLDAMRLAVNGLEAQGYDRVVFIVMLGKRDNFSKLDRRRIEAIERDVRIRKLLGRDKVHFEQIAFSPNIERRAGNGPRRRSLLRCRWIRSSSPGRGMTTTDTVLRQWQMLRLVPRYPQKISVQAIKGSLEVQGFETTERAIQRDLVELSRAFPLLVDERAKSFGWSWQRDAHSFDLPGLTVSEVLTWVLAEQHLQKLLPATIVEHLQPQFLAAHRRLETEPQPQRGRSWLDKVRTVPPAQPLIPPTVDADVQRVVWDVRIPSKLDSHSTPNWTVGA